MAGNLHGAAGTAPDHKRDNVLKQPLMGELWPDSAPVKNACTPATAASRQTLTSRARPHVSHQEGASAPPTRRRAHSVPIRPVNHGQQRCDPVLQGVTPEHVCPGQRPSGFASALASQAESASSILVTRSRSKPQVNGLGFVCCLVQFEGCVPSACPKSTSSGRIKGVRASLWTPRASTVSNGGTHFLWPAPQALRVSVKSHAQSRSSRGGVCQALACVSRSASKVRMRCSISSRMGRTASTPCPAGSSNFQSR